MWDWKHSSSVFSFQVSQTFRQLIIDNFQNRKFLKFGEKTSIYEYKQSSFIFAIDCNLIDLKFL